MRKLTSFVAALMLVPLVAVLGADPAGAGGPGVATEPLVLVRDLNWPFIDQRSTASAVNASGQVVGDSEAVDDGRFGYLTDSTNTGASMLRPLVPRADHPTSTAYALNGAGVVAGASPVDVPHSLSGPDVAVVWDSPDAPTSLGTIGNRPCTGPDVACDGSSARGINNTGTAVGVSDRDDGSGGTIHHAFADALGTLTMTDLGTLAGGSNSEALGVNDSGLVVGDSETADGGGSTTHAFTYDLSTHTMADLGTLPGGTTSGATAVNVHGLVVGTSTVTGGANHPFTYDASTHTMTDLGLPPGATGAQAAAVNGAGLVVGNSDAGAWVYDSTSKTFASIAGASTATGINDSNEIVGVGQVQDPLDPNVSLLPGAYLTFARTAPPNPPTNLHIDTACGSAPVLRWTASAPELDAPADGYVVFRNGVMLAKVTGTAYTDASAIAPATYRVAAINPVGFSTMTNAVIWTCSPGIAGTVTAGGSALGGIDVRVYDAGTATLAAKAQTDPSGQYGLPGLAAGSYNVRFSDAAGRVALAWNGGAATRATAPTVLVTAGTTVTVDAALVVAGHITGKVTDPDPVGLPEPVPAVVRVYQLGGPSVAKVSAGEDGTYDVGGLAPGSYQLQFSDPSGRTITVWNGGGTARTSAPAVTVTGGASTVVDVSTVRAAFTIGTVSGNGTPLAGIDVRMYVAGTDTLQAKTVTASDGTYLFTVAPGVYQIRYSDPTNQFALQWATGATKQSHATSFTLAAGNGPTVDITLVPTSP